MTDIIDEISAASQEQAPASAQVNQAVTQMDQITQQNAALVEEMAAAATSLHAQGQQLLRRFRYPAGKITAPLAARPLARAA